MLKSYKKIGFTASLIFFLSLAGTVSADEIGRTRSFYTDTIYDAQGRDIISVTLRHISDKAYFYVEDDYWNALSSVAQDDYLNSLTGLGYEFDNVIYPTEVSFFGSEPNPGVDNDSRITVVLTRLAGNVGGYINTINEYPAFDVSNSNEREMVYLNAAQASQKNRIRPFLAHEFQHLISHNQKNILNNTSDDVWLNELRSEYAISLLGYNDEFVNSTLRHRRLVFQEEPSDSLTEWKNLSPDYSQVTLFGEYVAEHWSPQVVTDTSKTKSNGLNAINETLIQNGFQSSLREVFSYWLAANIINDTSANPKFGYSREELKHVKITPTKSVNNFSDGEDYTTIMHIKDWESRWLDFTGLSEGQTPFLRFSFSSSSLSSFTIAYLVFYEDGATELRTYDLNYTNKALIIPEIGSNIRRVVIMPFKRDRLAGFSREETSSPLVMNVTRTSDILHASILPDSLTLNQGSTLNNLHSVQPENYGLKEGDFIRATGDKDVYIINQFGYKRLVLSPEICLQYGHLGARGCFSAINEVAADVRDAFITSWYYTNGETKDGLVYQLKETGEDSARLILRSDTIQNFIVSGSDANSVFRFNSLEQGSYSVE